MNAVGFSRFGDANVLERLQFKDPMPGNDDVLIRMSCTSINRLDTLVRKGYMGALKIELPHVPGSDVVGRIEHIGKNVNGLGVGDMAIANSLVTCGICNACISGNESICSNYKIVGREMDGSYGELVKLQASQIIKAPKGFSEEELACMPLSLATAWRSISTVADAKDGDTIVVRGASGNVGIFAVLLSKAMGLRVIALTGNEEKMRDLKNLGADLVINTNEEGQDTIKEVRNFTDGKGADIALESFGATIENSMEMLHDGGKVIEFGTMAGSNAAIDVKKIYLKSKSIIGTHVSSRKELEDAIAFMDSNNIRPVIGKRMKIDEAAHAHELLEGSKVFGKMVLRHGW